MTIDVKAILEECRRKGLKGIKEDANGWRAQSFYGNESVGDTSLAISKDGAYICFKTENSGSIVKLYADLIGKDYSIAKAELRAKSLLPKVYAEIKREGAPKKSEKEDDEKAAKTEDLLSKIRTDFDWKGCANWRGLPHQVFEQAVAYGALGYLDSYPVLGSCYAFICNTPPISGINRETKGVMLRATLPDLKDKWRNPVNYPIWAPSWVPDASHIILTEGQWDALAMRALLDTHGTPEDLKKYQVLALCGPKNVEKYPELMEYFTDKEIFFVPDQDEKGETILAQTSLKLEQVTKSQKILRVMGKHKDLNDWYKAGIDQGQFELWMEGQDPFRVSNGFIIDSAFRMEHGLKLDSIVEVRDDGEPVEIYQGFKKSKLYLDKEYILSAIEPFPVLRDYVGACLESVESPSIYHVQCFLAYEAGVIGRRFRFESGSVGCLYPNTFTLLIGPSGLGKSEAIKMLLGCVGRVNKSLFTSENFSAEALIDEFKQSPQKMLVTGEFAPWLKSREGSYRYWAMKNFLNMHGCEEYSKDRPYRFNFKKTSVVEIDEPCLSILSACTTTDIQNINSEFLTDGVVGRFLYPCGLDKNSDMPYTKKIPHEVMGKVETLFRAINGTPIRTNVSMRMSASADLIYRSAFEKQIALQKKIDPLSDAQTYSSRWKVNILKHAILFEVLRPMHEYDVDAVRNEIRFKRSDMAISEEAITAAIKIVELLNQSFQDNLLFQYRKSDSVSFASKIQQRIISFLKKHSRSDGTGVKRNDLIRFLQENVRDTDSAVEALKTAGLIFEKEIKPTKNGKPAKGRPTTVFLLADEPQSRIPGIIQITTNQNYQGAGQINGQAHHSEINQGHPDNGDIESSVLG